MISRRAVIAVVIGILALSVYLLGSTSTKGVDLYVDDFPGGPGDDTAMIQDAIDHAKMLGTPVTLHFQPKKCYFVSKNGGGTPGMMPFALGIEEASHLTLEGHGAELRCTDRDTIIIHVFNSSSIRVSDLRFDYYPCQFTQGKVIEVFPRDKEFDLLIDSGHVPLSDPWFDPPSAFSHHAVHLQADRDEWVYDSVAHAWLTWRVMPSGVFRCRSGHVGPYGWYEELDISKVKVGDRIVVAGIWGEQATKPAGYPTNFDQCSDCTLADCEFYNGEAFTQCFGGTRMTVTGCKFIPRKGDAPEGVDRIWAGVGDGALFEHMDEGPYVLNSEIRCVPDDIMNFNCPPSLCYEVSRYPGGRTRLQLGGWVCETTVKAGDTLIVSDGTTGLTKGKFVVDRIVSWGSPFLYVETLEPVPDIKLVPHEGYWPFIEDYNTLADKIENFEASDRNAVVRGNVFDSCGNFLRIPKMGSLIENNQFRNIAETPIMGDVNTYFWLDWPRHKGVTIRNNRFVNCQWTQGFQDQTLPNWHVNDYHRMFRDGIIHLSVRRFGGGMANPVVRDFEISNNVIEGWGQSAIRIECGTIEDSATRNSIFANQLIEREYAHPKRFLDPADGTYPIVIANTEQTNAIDTLVTLLPNSSALAVLRIDDDCESTVDWSFDPRSQIPSGIPEVEDRRTESSLASLPSKRAAAPAVDTRVVDATASRSVVGEPGGPSASCACSRRHREARHAAQLGQPRDRGTFMVLGSGCEGTVGTPRLLPANSPYVGEELRLEVRPVAPAAATVGLLLGFEQRIIPLGPFGAPGCTLYLDPVGEWFRMPMAGREASIAFLVPDDAALVGAEFYVQAFVSDPSANRLGLVVTNALHGIVGQR